MLKRAHFVGAALLPIAIAAVLAACTKPGAEKAAIKGPVALDQARLLKGTSDTATWGQYGGSFNEQRFSPLTDINDTNIKNLGLAWYGDYDTNQNQHGSPLYVDGVIYVSTARNNLLAFDARTGKRLWTYAPVQIPHSNLGLVNRGIAAYNGKIYMGTLDGRLVAVNAKTGKSVWEVEVAPKSLVGTAMYDKYSESMAPRVAKGKVFIGASGGEYGVRGFIVAYDADTGKEAWRFWTVPGDPAKGPDHAASDNVMKMAAATWSGEFWKNSGGGGTIWDAIVYDPVTDLLYFGTGNGAGWNSVMRDGKRGDNLFIASMVAVKPDTGEYVWHYQETPGDSWDYDAISPMMTADLVFNGVKKHVILQPSKNGMMYVVEAATGKLISGDAFTTVNWNTGVDLKTGRPIEVPGARYETENWNVSPGAPGGHTWHQNAFSPVTNLIYIPTWENYSVMSPQKTGPGTTYQMVSMGRATPGEALKPNNNTANNGWLEAWDPVARKIVWQTPKQPRGTSGVLATGGNLVFMGNSGGKHLSAYNAKTGEKLWDFDAQTDVYASPITYQLDGVQYVAASVGGTAQGDYFAPSYARMLVFKVGGNVKLPPNAPYTPRPLNPPPSTAAADVIAHGSVVYADNCAVCHGPQLVNTGRSNAPSLATTPLLYVQEGFDQVVLKGGRVERGMLNFGDKLKPEDSVAVRAYIVSRANELKNAPPPPAPAGRGAGGARPAAPPPAPANQDIHQQAAGGN